MTNTSVLNFTLPAWQTHDPGLWLKFWASSYESTKSRREDNRVYYTRIGRAGKLAAEDFETVGRWKEGCLAENHGSWKPNTPAAYEVWMRAKDKRPTCPPDSSIPDFLTEWSDIEFTAGVSKKTQKVLKKRFGLSRSTALLHFVSGGRFPIFDSRVRKAIKRLGSSPPTDPTVKWYLDTFCQLCKEMADLCGVSGTRGLRLLDNALFCYGGGTKISLVMIDKAVLLGKSNS